jgi:predicted phosphodiesterase
MIAILSDIHANFEALQVVLERCEKLGVKEYWCLGDVIGYGPDPVEVTRIARKKFDVSLMGNHEEALVTGRHRFNPYAAQAIDWTRQNLRQSDKFHLFGPASPGHLKWYEERKPFVLKGNVLLVHGSIYDPVHDYVDEPENPVESEQMIKTLERDFSGFDLCFAGHNHSPFMATMVGILYPHDRHNRFVIPKGHKAYICVGSVGQPRDNDCRASFATFDGEAVQYHRLEYDVAKTAKKIIDQGLNAFLAERLQRGI